MKESWKEIKGYEGLYEVSNFGRVKSFKGRIERILKERVRTDGYSRVGLWKDKVVKDFLIHRLVADSFIPNKENKPFVNHIDNNPNNNHIENLEWCTPKENSEHMTSQKRHRHGSNHTNSKLTENKVHKIKKMLQKGKLTHEQIAKKFQVSRQAIGKINTGKAWSHVS